MIEKNFKFKVGLDVDEVLLPCIPLAIEKFNQEENLDIQVEEITGWLPNGSRADGIIRYFGNKEFYEEQRPFPGAKDFVKKLSKKAEIFVVTAIRPEFMGLRCEQIQKFFPEIPPQNIIPAYRKDVMDLDFLLDDKGENILASNVKYPVLFRRPWNQSVTGTLAVNSYEEFLNLIDCIKDSYLDSSFSFRTPTVIALVGPSGSGKTAISLELTKNEKFGKPISSTTRAPRAGETENSYHFVSKEEFARMKKEDLLAESTVYAGNSYGVELASVNKVLKEGKHCVIAIDISGAMALKMQYRTCIVYVKRNRPVLIDALIQRVLDGVSSKEDVVQRIVSLSDEKKNERIADYVLKNDGTVEQAAQEVMSMMRVPAKS